MSKFYKSFKAPEDGIKGYNIFGISPPFGSCVECTNLFLESKGRFFMYDGLDMCEIPEDPRLCAECCVKEEGLFFLPEQITVENAVHVSCITSCDGFEKTLRDLKAPCLESMILKTRDGTVTFKIAKRDEIVTRLIDYSRLFLSEAERRFRERVSITTDGCTCTLLHSVFSCLCSVSMIEPRIEEHRDTYKYLNQELLKQLQILKGVDCIVSGHGLARRRRMFPHDKNTNCVNPSDSYPFVNTFEEYEALVQEKLNELGIDKKVW